MARWAIGDVQGCCDELEELLVRIRFSAQRDRLWFTGDLVNRGPKSLQTLRLVRSLADNSCVVLGNHDLHLLAIALVGERMRKSDTLQEIIAAPDRDKLLDWLRQLPLAHHEQGDLMVHAGLVPQWSIEQTLALAAEVQEALRRDAAALLASMYGDKPDHWKSSLRANERLRFTVNVLTRLRVCSAEGQLNLKYKGSPKDAHSMWMPWFKVPGRESAQTRVVFGHWSALGFYRADNVLGLDTGCVWGGKLTAVNLDDADAPPITVPSRQPRSSGE